MLRIIDNKRIDLTDDEWALFQQISKSYDRLNFSGKDLFQGLFETNEKGIIVFLRPPSSKTSMEVFLFLVNVMVHQQLGVAMGHVDRLSRDLESKIKMASEATAYMMKLSEEVDAKLKKDQELLESLEEKISEL